MTGRLGLIGRVRPPWQFHVHSLGSELQEDSAASASQGKKGTRGTPVSRKVSGILALNLCVE